MPTLHLRILGGFRAERSPVAPPVGNWQRQAAKTLIKVLATSPAHALHREQIVDILWPGVEIESAMNSLGKALHAARHALEPELPPRGDSAYMRLSDSIVSLAPEHVLVDADQFERLAEDALRSGDIAACEGALAAYGGELLPENRYEDWCADRRTFIGELRLRVLLELADALTSRGSYNDAAARLREVVGEDPTREAVHRQLMRLYVQMGTPDQAVRQFHLCEAALRREFDLAPGAETVALYESIRSNRLPESRQTLDLDLRHLPPQRPLPAEEPTLDAPFIGRAQLLSELCDALMDPNEVRGGVTVVCGEAGVGKTRFLEELAAEAAWRGACVLRGGTGAHATDFACGPFAVALERYAASRAEVERDELAQRYPALARFVPSLGMGNQLPRFAADPTDHHLGILTGIVRLMTDLARNQPVLLVLGDLVDIDRVSLDVIRYLAQLAVDRPWMIIGATRAEDLGGGGEIDRTIDAMVRDGLCRKLDLPCLSRAECEELVRAMLTEDRVDDELVAQIYDASRGNPLFACGLVRELQHGAADGTPEAGASRLGRKVPAPVRALLSARVASLDRTTRRVLELVAAADSAQITLHELGCAASALDPPITRAALLDALDHGLELRLLEERTGRYAFRHPLLRLALRDELSRHRAEQLLAALSRVRASASSNGRSDAGIDPWEATATG